MFANNHCYPKVETIIINNSKSLNCFIKKKIFDYLRTKNLVNYSKKVRIWIKNL